jgi:uncharacterized protein (UPF0210 family)
MYNLVEQNLQKYGLPVQTRRLALEPVHPSNYMEFSRLVSILDSATSCANLSGIRWLCLPISGKQGWGMEDLRKKSKDLIRHYPMLFVHHILAENEKIYHKTLHTVANSILDTAKLSNNGFDNFRMGGGANISPNTPFFPFSWHYGLKGFSLAVEVLGPVIAEVENSNGLALKTRKERLIKLLTTICSQVDTIARHTERELHGEFEYKGIDISLAPYPDEVRSVAKLVEHISDRPFGDMGTLTATGFLTSILKESLDRAQAKKTGFNGVMYSQLEDRHLANTVNRNKDIMLEHFMLYSTVCGCGVDMVPVPGNMLCKNLESLLLDVATLSCRHSKPLGVRVLPIPLKRVNEHTDFNHDFLINSRILDC